jgi:chemotaxis protein histidine kinase CheA
LDTASQQRILGYFIEEAKEHLHTLEQGILQLSSAVQDTEMVNEMFRAAHSVKGGAAMLGYTSIQKTAHRLEDSFKFLKENSIPVDQKLESLFLAGYDFLQDLVEKLENSSGFRDEDAGDIVEKVDANFLLLQNYLQELMNATSASPASKPSPTFQSVGQPQSVAQPRPQAVAQPSVNITEEVKNVLKDMLQLFKQKDTPENRQALERLCLNLGHLAPNQANWQKLVRCAQAAVANSKYAYSVLAPTVIKELKLGSDYLQAGQGQRINPSQNLRELAATSVSQITIPIEPQAAAAALLQAFSREQLSQLVQILNVNL